jgi:polyisoprenoid-binding protein YceI
MRHFALLFLLACAPDVAKDKPAATVAEPSTAPAAPAPTPSAEVNQLAADFVPVPRKVDPARSKVHALGAKITRQHLIEFPTFSGEISAQKNFVDKIDVTVQVADLTTDVPKLVEHLKSPDFFDVAQFPTAHFVSTSVVAGEGGAQTVTGDMTLHGVTKSISFPATIEFAGTDIKAHAEFSINRKDFGIVYPGKPDDLIQDNVLLTLDLVAAP